MPAVLTLLILDSKYKIDQNAFTFEDLLKLDISFKKAQAYWPTAYRAHLLQPGPTAQGWFLTLKINTII